MESRRCQPTKKEVQPPKQAKINPKNKRSNSTFFRFTIPPAPDVKFFLKTFRRIFNIIIEVDKKAIILPKPGSPDNIGAITNP